MTIARLRLGAAGEDLAAQWYEHRGFEVVDRNWRTRFGEIDLVVAQIGVLAFCEVKTRSSAAFGTGFEAVTPRKQAKLRTLASEWLRVNPSAHFRSIRFDVASVVAGKIEVLEDAF